MTRINEYNEEVKNWDFEKEQLLEFLRLLTERNLLIQNQTPRIDFQPEYETLSRNVAVINSQGIKIPQQIAFHVGFPNQRRLYSMVDEITRHSSNEGVFFSLAPRDVSYFSGFDKKPLSIIYFLDTSLAKNVRVQTKYSGSVISRHDLDDILDESQEEICNLKEMHGHLNKKWIGKNTIPFDAGKLEEFKRKGYDWLVVPDPIDLIY